MNLLTINRMKKAYTDRILFNEADFSISEGEKVGVIGVNGTGKTTLLKIVAGLESMDEGELTKASTIKINYLSQNPIFPKGMTIYDYVITNNVDEENKWEIEGEAKTILNKLGLANYDCIIDHLSGGQKKRVALASILLARCDLLILDEPTNHMDNEMASWLEAYLNKQKKALMMVTHDRYFLDRICNRIVEIDNGKIYSYSGKYAEFLEQKTLREDIEQASERKRQSVLRVELEWLKRGARARSTKQKAHIQRIETLRDTDSPIVEDTLKMSSISQRLGKKTIILNEINKSYEDKCLIKGFTYVFLNGDRIGIIGKNGLGKSTLVKIIMGEVIPETGTIDIGSTVKIGYFSQENENLPENRRVIDYIKDTAEYVKTTTGTITASQMLTRFLFDDSLQYQLISKLSGGEKRRLYLLKVLMEAPNVLILDEPTNDLDIQTMAIFEEYLDNFEGIVIAVSHDRYFLNRVVDRIFSFQGNGIIKQVEGNYDDYIVARDSEVEEQAAVVRKTQKSDKNYQNSRSEKLKMTYNEKREFESIDDDIAKLEEKLEYLDKEIAVSATDFVKLSSYMNEKEEVQKTLETKMDRWVYLTDLHEKINMQEQG